MRGHVETTGTSMASDDAAADETAKNRTSDTSLSSDALELAFDAVGTAIEAFIDALSS
jgi:hypothetical protein